MIQALESGYFRREIANAAYVYQKEIDAGRKLIVGVNAFQETDEKPLEILMVDAGVEPEQIAALTNIKKKRAREEVRKSLDELRRVAGTEENLMPALLDAAQARASVGEIMNALADVFGRCDAGTTFIR
jgi:methylmalonyl-CoA mutase, N-terminal domain